MNFPFYFNSKNSLNLFGHKNNFNFLFNLYLENNLPKVLMLTGNKGDGKSTLINHFLFSVFDSKNYNVEKNILNDDSTILKQFKDNIFPNIVYVSGSDFKAVKVEDIRNLKTKILQSTISDKDRFIILDDIELFNTNSLNALLKIIEEPTKKNFFILINNKSKPLLETISSRSLEIKIMINENQRNEIIGNLINMHKLDLLLDPKSSKLSPGNFVKFNYICKEFDVSLSNNLIDNLSTLLNLYKKNKDILFINIAFFITDHYLSHLSKENILKSNKIYEIKNYIFANLNKFLLYNLNQKALLNSISAKINYE